MLTLFLTFIGRIFTAWPQKSILFQPPFPHSCSRTSSLHLRSTVLFLSGPGHSSFHSQIVCFRSSVPVHILLPSVGQASLPPGLLGQRMKGRIACWLNFWLVPLSILQSNCITLVLGPCMLNRVLWILFRTVFAWSASTVASNAAKIPLLLPTYQLHMISY